MGKKTNLKTSLLISVFFVAMAYSIAAGEVIYVDDDAPPGGNGVSWATAYKYLQDALADTNTNPDVNEVWVAQGIYTPDSNSANPYGTGDRTATFQLLDGVAIKGGYAGFGAPDPNARDIKLYETILSGDLAGNDVEVNDPCDLPDEPTRSENSYHVVTGSGTDANAILDGFTITAGNADGNGGGFYSDSGSPLISNCTFTGNSSLVYGGGLYIIGHCNAVIANCEIIGNHSHDDGGGMFIDEMGCSPLITNCIIKNNSAVDNGGGIRCDDYSTTTIANCLITANMSGDEGGGIACKWNSSSVQIENCTITENSAGIGGAIYCIESTATVSNCILWENKANYGREIALRAPSIITVSYSDVQGGRTSAYVDPCCVLNWDVGNIDTDPFFIRLGFWANANDPNIILEPNDPNAVWVDGNYHLSPHSPCIDAGDNNSVPADSADLDGDGNTVEAIPWDLDWNLRFVDDPGTSDTGSGDPPVVDMGAYEFQDISVDVIYVDDDAPPGGDGAGWGTAYKYLQDALAAADAYTDIRIAQGIYLPDRDSAYPGGTGNRRETFELMNNVALYGGYAGIGEPNQDERDIELYETILSGDFDGDDGPNFVNYNENSWHVITASGTDRSAILDGFTITGGNANYPDENACGAGMYCDNGKPTLSNCAFISNSAEFGGGIYNANNNHPKLVNCTFENNRATESSGGGIYSNSSGETTLTGCSFIGNSANVNGGGMYNYGSSHSTLTDCTFRGNSADSYGAGIYSVNSNSTMTNCMFIQNYIESGAYGGGIFISGLTHRLTNCTFYGNQASWAGGIYAGCKLTLIQCLFSGNSSAVGSSRGGGLYNSDTATLINCTFSGNSAGYGGGIFNQGTLSLCNCILWGNGDDDTICPGATVIFSCIQDDDPNDDSIPCGGAANGNIDDNPLFADANGSDDVLGTEDDNVRPTQGARCIDAGDYECAEAVGLTSDLDGKPRFIDDCKTSDWGPGEPPIIDMGAYEFLPSDFDVDGDVDWLDLDFFTDRWLYTGCSKTNCFCDGADLNCGGTVEFKDFAKLARYWLTGL